MSIIRTIVTPKGRQTMAKAHLKLVTPTAVKRSSHPDAPRQCGFGPEYLTDTRLSGCSRPRKTNRWAQRDAAMILVTYRSRAQGERSHDTAMGPGGVRNSHPARPQGIAGQP